jgi:hypothetical protein
MQSAGHRLLNCVRLCAYGPSDVYRRKCVCAGRRNGHGSWVHPSELKQKGCRRQTFTPQGDIIKLQNRLI